jgi:hypothetical protein
VACQQLRAVHNEKGLTKTFVRASIPERLEAALCNPEKRLPIQQQVPFARRHSVLKDLLQSRLDQGLLVPDNHAPVSRVSDGHAVGTASAKDAFSIIPAYFEQIE